MTKKSLGLFAAIVAAMIGTSNLVLAQESDGLCSEERMTELQQRVDAAAAGSPERGAAQAVLTDCRLRESQQELRTAQTDLVACTTSRGVVWTLLDECLGNVAPRAITDAECQSSCTSRGGRWEDGACECLPDFHHPRPGRRLPAATAACLCVPDRRRPPQGGGGGGGTPTPTPVIERSCPSGAVNLRGENMSGRPAPANDRDCDGWRDDDDNASYWPNPLQRDWDMDGFGDCDRDGDGDADGTGQDCDGVITDVCSENDPYRAERAVCIELTRLGGLVGQMPQIDIDVAMRDVCREHGADRQIAICRRLDRHDDQIADHDQRIRCLEDGDIWNREERRCEAAPARAGMFQSAQLTLVGGFFGRRVDAGLEIQSGIILRDRLFLHGFVGLTAGPHPTRDVAVGYIRPGLGLGLRLTDSRQFELRLAVGVTGMFGSLLEEGAEADFNGFGPYLQLGFLVGNRSGVRFTAFLRLMTGYADAEGQGEMLPAGVGQIGVGVEF